MATEALRQENPLVWVTNYPLAEIESREVIFYGGTIKEPKAFNNHSVEDLERMGICGVYAEAGRMCKAVCTRPAPKPHSLLGVEYVPPMR